MTPIETATIKGLLAEAKKNHTSAKRRFDKDDNSEDMRERDRWARTVTWLKSKLAVPPNSENTKEGSG